MTVSRGRAVGLLAVGLSSLVGCGSLKPTQSGGRGHHPSEVETREAYFQTPVIVSDSAKKIRRGMSRHRVAMILEGGASVEYGRGSDHCVVYPINGTQRWDAHGSPEADEWEFCFGRNGKLRTKQRLNLRKEPSHERR